jgi:hypothetical protein
MKKNISIFFVVFLLIGAASFSQQDLTDDEILNRFDELRFVDSTSFTFTSDVIAERPDGTDQATVKLSFKEIDGENYSRIEFLAPEEMIGEIYLTTPEGTFFSTPDAGVLFISGGQSVFGDATVVQTVGIPVAGRYQISSKIDITLEDGTAGIEFQLEELVEGDETFPTITVIADRETLTPRQMTVFAFSGDPVNTVTFEAYEVIGESDNYVQVQLIDSQIQPTNKTRFTISNVDVGELSDDLFNPDLLGSDSE